MENRVEFKKINLPATQGNYLKSRRLYRTDAPVKRLYKRRFLLAAEFILAFIALPTALYTGLIDFPKIPLLVALTLLCLAILMGDPTFRIKNLYMVKRGVPVKKMLVRFALTSPGVVALSLLLDPREFFFFPIQNTSTWLQILLLYPILSALPQELIYRSFFFHRYKELFADKALTVFTSTLAFSFMHIIYGNIIAVTLPLAGGYFFSKTYIHTRSLLITSLEHALYGCLIFTVGLGRYFVNM